MGRAALHIVALAGIGVAQPIYDVFSKHPDFFVAHDATRTDLLGFALLVSLGVPLLLFAGCLAARMIGPRSGHAAVHGIVGLLGALLATQLLERVGLFPHESTALAIATFGALTCAFTLAYRRFEWLRQTLSVAALAAFVFPILFLYELREIGASTPDGAFEPPRVESDAPVVVLIFDELPLASLLDRNQEIDAARFPNFARLAATSYWFRNATTVAERTNLAVPAMLTGRIPDPDAIATAAEHPQNLFTLFADRHAFSVFETNSKLCPESICESELVVPASARRARLIADAAVASAHVLLPEIASRELPVVTETWSGFGPDGLGDRAIEATFADLVYAHRFDSPWLHERFVNSFGIGGARTLFFLHLGMPHVPWRYLPSGHEYRPAEIFPRGLDPGDPDLWLEDGWPVMQAAQRHLLQVAYADRLLGETLGALESAGWFDAALLVVASDHGVAFEPGDRRRGLTDTNVGAILPVPLFVKTPEQKQGRVDERNAQTIDLLPTVADALGFALPEAVDGRSLLSGGALPRRKTVLRRLEDRQQYERIELDPAVVADARRAAVLDLVEQFGSGAPDATLFAIGPHPELVGKPIASLRVSGRAPQIVAVLDKPTRQLATVDPDETIQPVRVTGTLQGRDEATADLRLAVAINGVVRATTVADRTTPAHFSAMVPESSLHPGSNALDLFVVRQDAEGTLLERASQTTR